MRTAGIGSVRPPARADVRPVCGCVLSRGLGRGGILVDPDATARCGDCQYANWGGVYAEFEWLSRGISWRDMPIFLAFLREYLGARGFLCVYGQGQGDGGLGSGWCLGGLGRVRDVVLGWRGAEDGRKAEMMGFLGMVVVGFEG